MRPLSSTTPVTLPPLRSTSTTAPVRIVAPRFAAAAASATVSRWAFTSAVPSVYTAPMADGVMRGSIPPRLVRVDDADALALVFDLPLVLALRPAGRVARLLHLLVGEGEPELRTVAEIGGCPSLCRKHLGQLPVKAHPLRRHVEVRAVHPGLVERAERRVREAGGVGRHPVTLHHGAGDAAAGEKVRGGGADDAAANYHDVRGAGSHGLTFVLSGIWRVVAGAAAFRHVYCRRLRPIVVL